MNNAITKFTETERLYKLTEIERSLWASGHVCIAGADEVGRGPFAGPLCAACVMMPQTPLLEGVNDSKKLSPKKREVLAAKIKDIAIAYGIAFVPAKIIDEKGLTFALKTAFEQAYLNMARNADMLLLDAVKNLNIDVPQRSIIHGDALSYTIAAASIVAKVERDALMDELDAAFPQYGFVRNKGYGTQEHIAAIRQFGATREHRLSFMGKYL